jgi:hypothetical protein
MLPAYEKPSRRPNANLRLAAAVTSCVSPERRARRRPARTPPTPRYFVAAHVCGLVSQMCRCPDCSEVPKPKHCSATLAPFGSADGSYRRARG